LYYSSNQLDFNIGDIVSTLATKVDGLKFETTVAEIQKKYNLSESDFSKYSDENLINEDTISNDAIIDFYMFGNPWNKSNDGWSGYNYNLNTNYTPDGYAYVVNIDGNGLVKKKMFLKP